MLTKRIIPCLDVKNGRVVKGINFENLKDVGEPDVIAEYYSKGGADEIVFLDITASHEGRKTILDVVEKTANKVFIPLTVGGGIGSIDEIKDVLRAGADKVSLNSSAVLDPTLVERASRKFGRQCIVCAIDAKRDKGIFTVYINGGRINTGLDAVSWAKEAQRLGAGEILLTSMDADGTCNGYDVELTKKIVENVNIPVIASGGCGKLEDFYKVFNETGCDAALSASVFHYGNLTIDEVKEDLKKLGINVRL